MGNTQKWDTADRALELFVVESKRSVRSDTAGQEAATASDMSAGDQTVGER